jgi:hypothetical protein
MDRKHRLKGALGEILSEKDSWGFYRLTVGLGTLFIAGCAGMSTWAIYKLALNFQELNILLKMGMFGG